MNLADYLSELLGQYDEVSVPGLGYFVRVRVNAHYNDKDGRFYPPYHQVKFVPKPKDDDTFAQYIADKKNISLASSKYFAEKFISKLKEDAAKGKYLFADLGLFYTDQDQLVFKPNDRVAADPAFYGYPPVNAYRIGAPVQGERVKPVFVDTVSAPVVSPPPVQTVPQQQYYEEEVERKKPLNVWLVILIALSVIALGLFGVYKFYPEAFDKVKSIYHKVTGSEETMVPVYPREVKTDPVKKTGAAKDTLGKTNISTAAAADTMKHPAWAVILIACPNPQVADLAVRRYKNLGLKARSLNLSEIPGTQIKVSGGEFFSARQADSAKLLWIKQKKIFSSSYVAKINL